MDKIPEAHTAWPDCKLRLNSGRDRSREFTSMLAKPLSRLMLRIDFRYHLRRAVPAAWPRLTDERQCDGAYEALKADPTALIKELSSKGLLKYATAPALNACSRLLRSGNPVTKMTGVQYPFRSKCYCKSSPFSPGIFKSVIRQTVLFT